MSSTQSPIGAPAAEPLDAIGADVANPAPATVAPETAQTPPPSPFASFPPQYQYALNALSDAMDSGVTDAIVEAFADFADLRPVHEVLESSASREEKRAARDDFTSARRIHARAQRAVHAINKDAGATLKTSFGCRTDKRGQLVTRESVSATLKTREYVARKG